jgi:RHS repeat-associated protein
MVGSLAQHLPGATLLTLFDGRHNLLATADTTGQVVERYRSEPFGVPAVLAPDGVARPGGSAVGLEPVFGGLRHLPASGLYLARHRVLDPRHGVFLAQDPLPHYDSPFSYGYAAADPVDLTDPSGAFVFLAVLAVVAVGAVVAGGINAARQGIQIAEGSRKEFSWSELGWSAGKGAVAAPILVLAPELAVPLAGLGIVSGVEEMAQGNYATGTFDVVTSLAPFGFKGPRTSTFGPGTRFGQMRGLGQSASWGARFGRFQQLDAAGQAALDRVLNKRLYRGTTYYEALEAEQSGLLDLAKVLGRQREAKAPPRLGPGLYFTEALDPPAQGTAGYWADFHARNVPGGGGGSAVLEASMRRWNWAWLQRQPGVASGIPQPRFPAVPSTLETYVPEGLAPWFNQRATWRVLPDPAAVVPPPSASPLWPSVFTGPAARTGADLGRWARDGDRQPAPTSAAPDGVPATGPSGGGKKPARAAPE